MVAKKKKFEDYVEPRLKDVKKMAANGLSNLEIAKSVGVSEATFYSYIEEYPTLKMALVRGRQSAADEIKAAMFKRATGFTYTEKKKVKKKQGGETITVEEEVTKYSPPSETAAALLLRQWDETYRDRDSKTIELKEKELDLKRDIAESNYFLSEQCDEKAQNDENINEEEM